jgi:hypothetical protein
MRRYSALKTDFLMILVLLGALAVRTQGQEAQTPGAASKEPQASELKGLPPRAAPTEYQSHAQAGIVTIGAEFMGHSVPTPEGTFNSEDYVVVEVGIFGPPQAQIRLASAGGDFSLRINGKKTASPSQPYELAFKSLKDPEWEPPKSETKSKTSIGGSGGNDVNSAPPPPKMPMDLRRAMERRVQRAAMLEGDRALPQAGLLFFDFRGKAQSIRSVELIYSGSAGNATLTLQP